MNETPSPKVSDHPPLIGAHFPAPVLLFTLLAAVLRLPFLTKFGLWLDEIYVRENVLEPIHIVVKSVHFLHFLAIKPWLTLSDSDLALRLASGGFGIVSVPLAWLVTRRQFGSRTAMLFAFCVAISPYFINYSIDANYYSHMMFWCLLGLGASLKVIDEGRGAWIGGLLALGLAAFFVHPFSAIYFASIGLVSTLAYLSIRRNALRAPSGKGDEASTQKVRISAVGLIVLMGFIALWALQGTPAGRQMSRAALRFSEMIQWGESPSNIEFSFAFFENYLRRIGPAYYRLRTEPLPLRVWNTLGTVILLLAFVRGLSRLTHRPALALLLAAPFLISFLVIFNLRAERHFNVRYFSYLVPLYWLGIAAALADLNVFSKKASASGVPLENRKLIAGIPYLLLPLLFAPQYVHLLSVEGKNWDAVMPAIANRIQPGEPIVYTNWAEETLLAHYASKYELPEVPQRQLLHTSNRPHLTAAELREIAYDTPALWFVSSWNAIESPEAVAWARSRMEPVAAGSSVFSNMFDVHAWHWDWGGRYVLAPRLLHYEPRESDFSASRFTQSFLIETALEYEIRGYGDWMENDRGPGILINGQSIPMIRTRESTDRPRSVGRARLETGVHEIVLEGTGIDRLTGLAIVPIYEAGQIPVQATEASDFYPSDYVWSVVREDGPWLCLKRNTFASYVFGVPQSGLYQLTCRGLNDKPGPVWIEIRIDGSTHGVLQFAGNDNVAAELAFPLSLDAGNRRVTVRFLNEGFLGATREDHDRDAWIERLEFKPIRSLAESPDDRVFIPSRGAFSLDIRDTEKGGLSPVWETVTDGDIRTEVVKADIPGNGAWKATIPRNSRGLLLKSPPLRIGASRTLYASGLLRAENLLNHSINMKTFFLDREGTKIGEKVVNQEGIFRSTSWVRFVDFQPVPDEVAYVQVAFWGYPNGRRPSEEPGTAWFGDFRIETGPLTGSGKPPVNQEP